MQMSPDKAPTIICVSSLSDFTVQLPSHLTVVGCPMPQDPAGLPLFPLGQQGTVRLPEGLWRLEVAEQSREWGKRLCLLDGPDTASESEDDRGAHARPGPVIRAVRIGAWALDPKERLYH